MLDSNMNNNYFNDCKFVLSLMYWVNGGTAQQPGNTTTAKTVTNPSSCNYTPLFSLTESSSNPKSKNTNADFLIGLIFIPLVTIVRRKVKKS